MSDTHQSEFVSGSTHERDEEELLRAFQDEMQQAYDEEERVERETGKRQTAHFEGIDFRKEELTNVHLAELQERIRDGSVMVEDVKPVRDEIDAEYRRDIKEGRREANADYRKITSVAVLAYLANRAQAVILRRALNKENIRHSNGEEQRL